MELIRVFKRMPQDPRPVSPRRRLAIRSALSVREEAHRRTYWTRERVVTGLLRFYRERGIAPTGYDQYHQMVKGKGQTSARRYPSSYAVMRHFATFREAWRAVGVAVNRAEEPWTDLDDWYIREAAGLVPRVEIARDLERTEGGVKRRMYELGLIASRAQGWTAHRLEREVGIPSHVLRRYMDRGELPYLRTHKYLFFDPADFLVVEEIDWGNPPAELARAVRRSLVERVVRILSGQDWRVGRPYQAQPIRTTDRRWRLSLSKAGPRPNGIGPGDWVRCAESLPDRPLCQGRVGLVHLVYWRRNTNRSRADSEPCWMARVEFRKLKARGDGPRVTYTVPLAVLEIAERPETE